MSTTLLPYLRPSSWPHLHQVPHHPLLAVEGVDVPYVTYVATTQQRVITTELMRSQKLGLDELAEEAMLSLSERAFDLTPRPIVETGGALLISVTDEFAAEAVACPQLMHAAHDALGSERLAAAIPARGVLLIADGRDESSAAILSGWAREIYSEAGDLALTPHLIMLRLGVPEGVLKAQDSATLH